ncbi:MAG: YwmB family TATA-box binding protein [Bacillota bacterium]|nr:YwmB family TATA-box binding protein [Bacillota bacterium]
MLGDRTVWARTIKQAAVLLAVIVVVAAAGNRYGAALWRTVTRTPEPLLAACAALGCEPQRAVLTGWAETELLSDIPRDEMRRLAWEAMVILAGSEMTGDPVEGEVGAEDGVEYTLLKDNISFRTYVRYVGAAEKQSLFMVCSVEVWSPKSLEARRSRLEQSLHTLGKGIQRREPVYVTVHSRLAGARGAAESEQESKKVMARLRAQQLDELGGEGWYAVLAHSPLLGAAIPVAGNQVNLSLVFRRDVDADCTWVVIGSPLCAGDY